jgi:hypothetical protein
MRETRERERMIMGPFFLAGQLQTVDGPVLFQAPPCAFKVLTISKEFKYCLSEPEIRTRKNEGAAERQPKSIKVGRQAGGREGRRSKGQEGSLTGSLQVGQQTSQ